MMCRYIIIKFCEVCSTLVLAPIVWCLRYYYLVFHFPELLFKFDGKARLRIGFKATEPTGVCMHKRYSIGKIYTEPVLKMCDKGMHYCKYPWNTLKYYGGVEDRLFLIVALGDIVESNDKCATDKIMLIRELPKLLAGWSDAVLKHTFLHIGCILPKRGLVRKCRKRGFAIHTYMSACFKDAETCNNSQDVVHSGRVNNCWGVSHSTDVTGSHGIRNSTDVLDSACVRYSTDVASSKDVNYSTKVAFSDGVKFSENIIYSNFVYNSKFILYSSECHDSKFIFGCTKVKGEKFKILNISVTEETYFNFMLLIREYQTRPGFTSVENIKQLCKSLGIRLGALTFAKYLQRI